MILKKAYDSVPIFNILTKLYNLGIRGKCHLFLRNLYLSSKARAFFNGNLSEEFSINRGVRQGCPLSPILFNLFINDVLDNCDKYGVNLESQYCCGGLFADDIVLVAPSKQALKKILNKVHEWAIKNEMTFGINKCATLVVKPINFVKPINYEDPSFFIGSNKLPKTDNYTYLGIPFDESLSLKPIQSKLNSNLNVKLNSYFRFLINKSIPLPLKKYVLISFILSLVLYYAPLFGSNKNRCSKAQKIINRGLYWSYGFKSRNSYVSLYDITRELRIPPLSAICAISQLRCFRKWKNSSCIINHLTNNIPTMSHYSWTKESRTLDKKLNGKRTSEIKKFYWERDVFKPSKAKKAIIYKENDFGFISEIKDLTFQYPKYQLGFFWISRIRCGFKFDISISIKRKIVSEDCPKCCPCCGVSVPSFSHWIFACKELENYRNKSLPFLDDLFLKFAMIIEQKSLDVSTDSEKDYDNNIYYFILSALLGGRSIYEKIKLNDGEQRQLVDNIFKQSSTSSTVPYFVGIAEFLTNVIPFICRSFRLMMKWYSVESIESTVAKSVDVEMIRHGFSPPGERSDTDSVDNTNTEIIALNNGRGVIIDEWEKLETIASNALL